MSDSCPSSSSVSVMLLKTTSVTVAVHFAFGHAEAPKTVGVALVMLNVLLPFCDVSNGPVVHPTSTAVF